MLPEREAGLGADLPRASTTFKRPWAFWLGVGGVTAGVCLHIPMFLSARHNHYMLSGMPWDGWMIFGMGLMLVGYILVLYGLAPRFSRGATGSASDLEF